MIAVITNFHKIHSIKYAYPGSDFRIARVNIEITSTCRVPHSEPTFQYTYSSICNRYFALLGAAYQVLSVHVLYCRNVGCDFAIPGWLASTPDRVK